MGVLDGKVAIVTGASAGIGRASALALAAAGARVVLADRDADRGPGVVEEITAQGGEAVFVATDVADSEQVAAMVQTAVDTFGGLHIAFNNAGIEGTPAPIADGARENWDRTIAINLTGVYLCMQAEIPAMRASGGGSVINCASVAGIVGFPMSAPYVASKHGVVGITKSAALELAPEGIRVNAVCPGVIDTEMITRATAAIPEILDATVAAHPLGRMGRPEEIASTVVWLASEGAGFVTGQAIAVDGGFTTG